MGNFTSCCSPNRSNIPTATLFDAQGNLRRLKVPITAAELMVEEPGHFISSVEDIRQTRRVPAMKADDELEAGEVYLLVPLYRVNCRVSELEIAILESTTESRGKKPGSSKVLPAATDGEKGKSENTDLVRVSGDGDTCFSGNRMRSYRQWIPALEPISEGC